MPECSADTYSLCCDQLCVSVLTAIYYTKKLLQWDVIAALIYGHRDTGLEGSWAVCPFSEIIAVGSPLGLMSSPALGSWPDLYSRHAFPSADPLTFLLFLQPWTYLTMPVTVAHRVHSWVTLLMSFPRCLHSSFQYCESQPAWRKLPVSTSLISSCFVTKVCDVFRLSKADVVMDFFICVVHWSWDWETRV